MTHCSVCLLFTNYYDFELEHWPVTDTLECLLVGFPVNLA